MKQKIIGPSFIALAAALWAFDALFRTELTFTLAPVTIVFYEHLFGLFVLSPFLYRLVKRGKLKLKSKDILAITAVALFSSVLGGLLFTYALDQSFAQGDFATPILLQKLQPLFVVILAALFLKEKPSLRFLLLIPVVLIGSYMLSFGSETVDLALSGKLLIVSLAVGAAMMWASGTILSKWLLQDFSFTEATTLRFLFAVPISFAIMLFNSEFVSPLSLELSQVLRFAIIALTTGAGAIVIYYRGLAKTKASVATFAELSFPIVSLIIATTSLNPYGASQVLSLANIFGVIILIISVLIISLENKHNGAE